MVDEPEKLEAMFVSKWCRMLNFNNGIIFPFMNEDSNCV